MNRIRYYWDYIKHLLMANTRHGTHSPFVYRLLDETVYPKRRVDEPIDKVDRLVTRLSTYLAPREFIIADEPDTATLTAQLQGQWPQLHHGRILIVKAIYRDAGMKRLWHSIKGKPEVTVTIDLFHMGLVFFHHGQAKEDFKIRY